MGLVFEAASEKLQQEHEGRAWLAWHIPVLTRMDPKKFPKLDSLTGRKRDIRAQTQEQLEKNIKLMLGVSANGK